MRRTDRDPAPRPMAKNDIGEAMAAQRETSARFIEAAHQGTEVRRIASEFRGIRERNGFGRLISESMGLR